MIVNALSLGVLRHDADELEGVLRQIVAEHLALNPIPTRDDAVIASYYLALRTTRLEDAVKEIAYHATSGIRNPPPGTLLSECTAELAGIDAFDSTGRIGLVHVAFPLKMLLAPDGHLTSSDLLHITAGAIIFDIFEHQDARLIGLQLPESVLRTFPGPAYGPEGIRELTGFGLDEPAFGTILKPTAGITPDDVERLVSQIAVCPLFLFVKEDENLLPNLDYSPVADRVRRAVTAIERAMPARGERGLIYAPHISGAPGEILESVHAAVEAGATGVMFSETFSGGTVRMVRDATKNLPKPPAIYGHNAGIGVKTRAIWREVIDFLARLDGIDFRQTAPVRPGAPFLRPFGAEWEASEEVLSRPLPGIKPTMVVRAGSLDQGNIGLNLADAERRGITSNVLFLAGSAINAFKNDRGEPDPGLGAEAMIQAIEVHRSGELAGIGQDDHLTALFALATQQHLEPLRTSLVQRYGAIGS
ncbi:hypothetical protein BH09CHL1_BH09CHL1_15760 [soil metagenome]